MRCAIHTDYVVCSVIQNQYFVFPHFTEVTGCNGSYSTSQFSHKYVDTFHLSASSTLQT